MRLLTTKAVMGDDCLTIKEAWRVYDQWLLDPRVDNRREPVEVDDLFRRATAPFFRQSSPKALGDCYLLGLSQALHFTLVTFDAALFHSARKAKHDSILLA